jgi:hypothetical protein
LTIFRRLNVCTGVAEGRWRDIQVLGVGNHPRKGSLERRGEEVYAGQPSIDAGHVRVAF